MTISASVRAGLPTIFMPEPHMVLEGREPGDALDATEMDLYNAKCTEIVIAAVAAKAGENATALELLKAGRAGRMTAEEEAEFLAGLQVPMIRTRYPKDDDGSEDVVTIDAKGNIVLLDSGTR